MINLEQVKADIAARKAMPAWGANTSIERIKTINATLPSFSLKTVEALVEMLESCNSTKAINDVIAERQRQQTVKGFSTEQDDTYVGFQLSAAAICYIEPMEAENYWPADWYDDSFKPTDTRRNLIKAAALIIAEIERLDRQLPEEGL
ncbi:MULTISPECIES: hypothetical protein [Klebsiella]|uniref:hypothetical protein n=1 Tax=Klebsiella TaxID=570 RepID=UPI0015EA510A|nr:MULTISPECIES: hypothetical protein [Klebsiella]MDM4568438.1 hypothetical protein [Klebsiella michiganensis]MDM4585746.1 hypothetical protein [Klebsiella michiganensis]QLX71373.1 hypothetical protein HV180_03195 [Klebsiella oxytoca]QLX71909.1 hypothetical protein HV180_06110 [Klebsiella oxytoca]